MTHVLSPSPNDRRRYLATLQHAKLHNQASGKYSMVAKAYRGKRCTGIGYNSYPSRRAGETYSIHYRGVGVHAELELLARQDVSGSTIYLAGVKQTTGYEITSKPCARCNNLLMNSRVKFIVYYEDGIGLVKVRVKDLVHRDVPVYNH